MTGSRSARLVERHAGLLDRACDVRFVREATAGTLPAPDFARYLLVEEAFVLTAARVLGRVVWESDGWAELLPSARSLTNLVTEQRDYFAGLRHRWPVEDAPATLARAAVLSEVVLRQVTEAGRPAALAGMLAAETMYARWCTAAAAQPADRHPDLQAWIELHAEPAFLGQVAALRDDVDALPPELADDTALDRWFVAVLEAEIAFHDAVHG
ncbi:TenA family protein [Modestobacter sp. VKM Ac-2985]|uniref:TenA family protein n=1 Tax=Modestobacter sp. VKM Ac-2985 TaxID=3004139 RepID=UPI0022AB8D33|nr:TenA family protein [Modestobacter sp. VKM Ac-2985]MCZ2837872.1 TenA family protein [Modestobacter sp. VKM Ac-2985]